MSRALKTLAAVIALSATPLVYAHRLAQPLSVRADSIQINQRTGLSVYQGHVRLVQDGLTVRANQVRVRSAHGAVLSIRAVGNPLHIEDQKTGGLPMFGQAQTLHFIASKDEVSLTTRVVFRQGADILHGHVIHYYVRSQRMTAIKGAKKRVRARIVPHTAPTAKPKPKPKRGS